MRSGGCAERSPAWMIRGHGKNYIGEKIIMTRKIAILGGTGAEGSGLAFRMAKAGEHVLIGSREAGRAQETARLLRERIGASAQIEGTDNPSAAAACDIRVLTVPFSRRGG